MHPFVLPLLGRILVRQRRRWKTFLILVFTCWMWNLVSLNHQHHQLLDLKNSSFHHRQAQESTTTKRQSRILLGIMSVMDKRTERLRRHVLRNTYLNFDEVHHSDTPNRVCSLQEFLLKREELLMRVQDETECQLVYTFVLGGNPKGISLDFNASYPATMVDPSSSSSTTTTTTTTTLQNNNQHETDVLYLNTPDATITTLDKVWIWYHYASTTIDSRWKDHFDYVAHTDTQVLVFPTQFWQNELFTQSNHETEGGNAVYGGFRRVEQSECMETFQCPSLLQDGSYYYMERFVLLSMNLVQHISNHNSLHNSFPPLFPNETPDVGIANMVLSNSSYYYPHSSIRNVQLEGILPVPSTRGMEGDLLQAWDHYKDTLVTYNSNEDDDDDEDTTNDFASSKRYDRAAPRLLMGIFTMDTPEEAQRREAIRKTYLRYYHHHRHEQKKNSSATHQHRICSLQDVLADKTALETKDCQFVYTFVMGGNPKGPPELLEFNETYPMTVTKKNSSATHQHRICSLQDVLADKTALETKDCQFVYTFVMGGNPAGPPELLEFNETYPMTVTKKKDSTSTMNQQQPDGDTVFLNIRENMEEGKSQTWFKYATTLLLKNNNHQHCIFDYIGKMDTDTLLFPNLFLDYVVDSLPTFPHNVRIYGGDYRIKASITAELLVGPAYMAGHLYWMSPDLANYITSPECNRTALRSYAEDISIGNFVHSHPLPIRRMRLNGNVLEHPIKQVDRFPVRWERFLSTQSKPLY